MQLGMPDEAQQHLHMAQELDGQPTKRYTNSTN
jgi:hypothetical protein